MIINEHMAKTEAVPSLGTKNFMGKASLTGSKRHTLPLALPKLPNLDIIEENALSSRRYDP